MKLANTETAYSRAAMAWHWIGAAAVLAMWLLGEEIEHAKEAAAGRDAIVAAIRLHVSIGMLVLLPLALRVVLHAASPQPRPIPQNRGLTLASKVVTWGLLAVIATQIVTGPLIVWSGGREIAIFQTVFLPSPFPGKAEALHETLEEIHAFASSLILPLVGLHVLGALKHAFFDLESRFRMIPGGGDAPAKTPEAS